MSASYDEIMRPRRDSARRVASLIAVGTIAGGDAAREEKTNGYNLSRMDWAQTGSLNLTLKIQIWRAYILSRQTTFLPVTLNNSITIEN